MRSALYEGVVAHQRHHPVSHGFTYRLAMPLVFLDEVEELCGLHPLWSNGRPNVVCYRRADYLGGETVALDDAVRQLVEERLHTRPTGPIAMLAHPRTLGWLFNPIALYYCFDAGGTGVEALVAEVTNTPWHERHTYVVGAPGTHRLRKALHVSPFMGMDQDYALSYCAPGPQLSVGIGTTAVGDADAVSFEAMLHLERHQATRAELGRMVRSHPFMTMQVSWGIYRQALALWRAGAPFTAHPDGRRRGLRSLIRSSVEHG